MGSLTFQATRQGVVSILAEAGSNGTLEPADVEIHMRGMRNVMRYLGMIPGEPDTAGEHVEPTGQFVVSAQRGGLLRLKIGIGDEIRERAGDRRGLRPLWRGRRAHSLAAGWHRAADLGAQGGQHGRSDRQVLDR